MRSLLQKLKPGNRLQQHIFAGVLYFALIICIGFFASLLNFQSKQNNVSSQMETLINSREAVLVSDVGIKFYFCPEKDTNGRPIATPAHRVTEVCDTDLRGKELIQKQFKANINSIPKIINDKNESVSANWAVVTYEISDEVRRWAQSLRSEVVLALPRNVHKGTYLTTSYKKNLLQMGYGSDTTFTILKRELIESKSLSLLVNIRGLPFFGPADIPAHLVNERKAADFLSLIHMQKAASSLARQFELGLPVVLAAIAIILDHSPVMSYLSLYAASRAIHDYIGFTMEMQLASPIAHKIYFAAVGTGFAFFVLFTATLVGINVRRFKLAHRWAFVIFMGVLFGLGDRVDKSYSTTSDLWGDTLAIFSCFLVMLYAAYDRIKNPPSKELKASNPDAYGRASVALVITRLALITLAFAVHGWGNLSNLLEIQTGDAAVKERLDWKFMLLMPSLMTAALLETGSTAKKMLTFGKDMAAKAIIEQELNVGREVQKRMLPEMRVETPSWSWRAFYMPAEALAGDWFDIRELEFEDGRTLVAVCVADVTGHGVGSSLATSVICSHWGLWCSRLRDSGFPETPEAKQAELKRAPFGIHKGLKALRENENCTAIFAIFDPTKNEITFCSAGHPGILSIGPKAFRYFTTQGERLGGELMPDIVWNAKTESLTGDEVVVLYSDGVVPLRATVSNWAAQIKRKVNSGGIENPELMFVNQLRQDKRGFRDAHDLVDDMTLVMVRRRSVASATQATDGRGSEQEQGVELPQLAEPA